MIDILLHMLIDCPKAGMSIGKTVHRRNGNKRQLCGADKPGLQTFSTLIYLTIN